MPYYRFLAQIKKPDGVSTVGKYQSRAHALRDRDLLRITYKAPIVIYDREKGVFI